MQQNTTFELEQNRRIEALNLEISSYRHTATGARHLHFSAEDNNNVFLVGFPTIPTDSTGVAHILEHTVLCGSRRFPVRDPFFMMIRRSLNTFMNAFTSSDWTAYPFATQNAKDFDNLLKVYLDAAFFPNLDYLDFLQEGHRMEFVDNDPSKPLEYKGVVFNEMKGALSSPVSRLWQDLQSHLFPTLTYHHNSGGDPREIPNLTHDQLKAFHARHYHPSNAIFMTYGNLDPVNHQSRFEEWVLSAFGQAGYDIRVGNEIHLSEPVRVQTCYPIAADETIQRKTHIVLGWLLGQTNNVESTLTQQLISDILLENSASPLRYALETSDLGIAPSPLCGFEDSMKQGVFACGLEGSDPDKTDQVESLVLNTLQRVAEEGVSLEHAESILHQLEFSQREVTGGGMPYGLQLMLKALPAVLHQGDPVAMLDIAPVLKKLGQQIRDPNFVKNEVRSLLENSHRVCLTMSPDPEMGTRQDLEEKQHLEKVRATMTDEEIKTILEQSEALNQRQQSVDDPDILPKLERSDIPASIQFPKEETTIHAMNSIHWYHTGTNGIVYQQLITPIPHLPDDLLSLVPLYLACLPELGCGERDYRQNQFYQTSICGGVSATTSIRSDLHDANRLNGYFVLAGKSLVPKQAAMHDLLLETFLKVRFDELEKIREIVSQISAEKMLSITGQGHMLAMAAATSGLSRMGNLHHQWNGLASIREANRLNKALENDDALRALAEELSDIHKIMVNGPLSILVVCEKNCRVEIEDVIKTICVGGQKGMDNTTMYTDSFTAENVRQAWLTGTQVNFCARAYPAVTAGHADAAAFQVLAPYLRNNFLHRAIREQGGAYGGGASYAADEAAFRFFSYRDPRLEETLEDFDRSIHWLLNERQEVEWLEEAILNVIAALDKPGSPAGECISTHFGIRHGRTPEFRNRMRQQVLSITLNDLQRVAREYLCPENQNTAIITSKEGYSGITSTQLECMAIES
ncbi:MAG: peptidase M16 [Gammaproteobacteria bacterium]|nr:MAG: peptidase M16 [Gammaproteobacteria bacterium]